MLPKKFKNFKPTMGNTETTSQPIHTTTYIQIAYKDKEA